MNYRVTWLMPVKDGMPFLTEALASIEAQTYKNFEMIAWDNGSTDESIEELKSWIPGRIPGRVVSDHPMTVGDSAAALVSAARTELCARMDADDVSLPTRLEKQVDFMTKHPEVGLLGARCEYIDAAGSACPAFEFPLNDADLRWRMRWEGGFFHSATLSRRSVILKAGNYRNCLGEDFELFLRMARLAEVCNLPEILVQIRKHARNTTAGITNYTPIFEHCAKMNAEILFEGIRAAGGIDLRRKVENVWDAGPRVTLADLFRLHRAATLTALAAGKPPDYFRSTELYRLQRNCIVRRFLAARPAGRALLRLKRAAASGDYGAPAAVELPIR